MIDAIEIVRAASQNIVNERMLEAAGPALVRAPSTASEKIIIQIPILAFAEEEKKAEEEEIKINTGEPEAAFAFCSKTLECGHACKGVQNEKKCLPCLNADCAQAAGYFEGVNEDELCTICYTCELGAEACTRLTCGHVFHTNCIVQLLQHKWTTLRITFGFMACPDCKQEM
jgi:hypothetical protein